MAYEMEDKLYPTRKRRLESDFMNIWLLELLVPDTASRQSDRIMKAVRTLDNMPERYKVYEEEPWKSQNLRYFPVDNYLVFYLPKERNRRYKYCPYYLWRSGYKAAIGTNN